MRVEFVLNENAGILFVDRAIPHAGHSRNSVASEILTGTSEPQKMCSCVINMSRSSKRRSSVGDDGDVTGL